MGTARRTVISSENAQLIRGKREELLRFNCLNHEGTLDIKHGRGALLQGFEERSGLLAETAYFLHGLTRHPLVGQVERS